MRRLALDERGANFVEYMIIVGVVALVGIGALATFGGSVTGKIAEQGERLGAMQGSVRSLDVRSRPSAPGAVAPGESLRAASSSETWESGAEPRTTRASADRAVAFDSVAIAVAVMMLVLVGAYLVYRHPLGRTPPAHGSLTPRE